MKLAKKAERSSDPEYMWAEHGASPWVIIFCSAPAGVLRAGTQPQHCCFMDPQCWKILGGLMVHAFFFHPVLPLCFLSFNPASEAR